MFKKILHQLKKYKYLIVILFMIAFISKPFIRNYIKGDDTFFHLINIEAYKDTSIFSKILPQINNNLGYGIGIFYPCLPHALGVLY